MTDRPASRDRDAELLAQVRALGSGTAWAIDAEDARVVAASTEGAARLGMRGPETPMALDAAMPALRRLREIAGRLASGDEMRETLLFWTAAGAESIDATVTAAGDAPGVFIVRAVDKGAPRAAQGGKTAAGRHSASAAPSAPDDAPEAILPSPLPRDDAATLREIARRIREGQGRRTASDDDAASAAKERAAAQARLQPPPAPSQAADIAKLAHELKTPLSAIVAASEIMRDQRLGPIGNERYRGYASDIHDSARHALAVINSLLGQRFDKLSGLLPDPEAALDGGEQPQLFAQVDINGLVEGTVSTMMPLADAARIALAARPMPRLPNVIADPVSLRQILLNLLTNALKFSSPGGRIVAETAYTLDGPLTITVRDSGQGMDADDIARALAPVRPDDSSAPGGDNRHPRDGGGLGIGLPLVRQLAEANGATVTIDSAPGAGTSVVVTFAKGRVVPV